MINAESKTIGTDSLIYLFASYKYLFILIAHMHGLHVFASANSLEVMDPVNNIKAGDKCIYVR